METLADMLATADGHASMKEQLRSAQEEANLAVVRRSVGRERGQGTTCWARFQGHAALGHLKMLPMTRRLGGCRSLLFC